MPSPSVLASAATTTAAAALLTLAVLVLAAGYALVCWLAPFGPCGRCHGHDRLCRRCDGTGLRVRAGRRLHTYLRALYREGRRPDPGRGPERRRRP